MKRPAGVDILSKRHHGSSLDSFLKEFECEPLADRLVRAGVPCAPIHDVPAALADPHTEHRAMVVEMGNGYRGVASPIKLSRTPATYRLAPPRASKKGGAA